MHPEIPATLPAARALLDQKWEGMTESVAAAGHDPEFLSLMLLTPPEIWVRLCEDGGLRTVANLALLALCEVQQRLAERKEQDKEDSK